VSKLTRSAHGNACGDASAGLNGRVYQLATFNWADDGGSTVAVIPDTQNYTGGGGLNFPVLRRMMDWLVAERESIDLDLVVQVGDLSDRNRPEEWRLARMAFGPLDGVLPYAVAIGNHDLGRREIGENRFTFFNDYFALDQNPLNAGAHVASWQEGRLENYALRQTLAGREWLILVLEFGPREGALAWAEELLRRHPGVPTLLVTHEFIDELSYWRDGVAQRSEPEGHNSPACYGVAIQPGGAACGSEVWRRLVEPFSQIRATVNGHYRPFARDTLSGQIIPVAGLAEAHRRDVRADGSIVDQYLFNAQWEIMGGNGWLLLLRVTPDGGVSAVKYSPVAAGEFVGV